MKDDLLIAASTNLPQFLATILSRDQRSVFTVLLTGAQEERISLNNEWIPIPRFSLVYIAPDCHIAIDHLESTVGVACFSGNYYTHGYPDLNILVENILFPSGKFTIYPIPVTYQLYATTIFKILSHYSAHNDKTIERNLAHNLIEQALIHGKLYIKNGDEERLYYDADNFIVKNFKTLVNQHVKNNRLVKFYADKLNITTRRLAKATQHVLGQTPKEIVTQQVVKQIKTELNYSKKIIKEIGHHFGFLDENNLSSFFSKEVGMTPKEYRKRTKATLTVTVKKKELELENLLETGTTI